MADTPSGETATPTEVKNEATPTVQPSEVKTEDNAVEQLKKELEQQRMRANQLENEKKARDEADAKAKERELEENNQYKELLEQERAKREALEQEKETIEKQAALEKAKAEVLNGVSDNVKKLADDLGLTLLDTDEKSVQSYKEKLDKIAATASDEAKVTPNNPNQTESKVDLTTDELRTTLQSDDAFHQLMVKKFPGIAQMTNKR